MKRATMLGAVATAAIGLTAVSNGAVSDPLGDAQDTFGAGGELLDVAQWDVTYDDTMLYFSIDFFTPIAPPSLELPNSMVGVIEIDVDQSTATGAMPIQNGFPGFAMLDSGVDFYIDLGEDSFNPGTFALRTVAFELIGLFPLTYSETRVSGSFSFDLIGSTTGIVDYTGTIGTIAQPTDATDEVGTSAAIPAPSALALLGLAGLAGRTRRRGA